MLQANANLDEVKGSDDYWRLNDARFNHPPAADPGEPDVP